MKGALMPYGSGQVIRQALIQAKPWQRYLIGVVMVADGVVLNVEPPLNNNAVQNQACSSASDCVVVGRGATGPTEAFTTNGATTWTATSVIGQHRGPRSLPVD
jgi:hypothetical protein